MLNAMQQLGKKSREKSKSNSKKPGLVRTFSSEYMTLKLERDAQRDAAARKKEQRKEHLASKEERLRTRRGRQREQDKGPALHGGRHKGNDMVDDDMLPPDSDG